MPVLCSRNYSVNHSVPLKHCLVVLTPDKTAFRCGDRIGGKLIMTTSADLFCYDIRMQLEANAIVKFQQKVDNRLSLYTNTEDLLPDDWTTTYLVGKRGNRNLIRLPPNTYTLPFSFPVRKVPLPGSFKGHFGNIQYRVAAYVQTRENQQHRINEKPLVMIPYCNLTSDPGNTEAINLEKIQQRSLFSKRDPLKFNLILDKTGYLAKENLSFILTLDNPSGREVTKVTVEFIHKVNYTSDSVTKSTIVVLAVREKTDSPANFNGETVWADDILIPRKLHPSIKGAIEHVYFLQVEVFEKKSPNPSVKGDVAIKIGTTRTSSEAESNEPESSNSLSAATSMQTLSDPPIRRRMSVPPAYPHGLARIPSLVSLPPSYSEAVGKFKLAPIALAILSFKKSATGEVEDTEAEEGDDTTPEGATAKDAEAPENAEAEAPESAEAEAPKNPEAEAAENPEAEASEHLEAEAPENP